MNGVNGMNGANSGMMGNGSPMNNNGQQIMNGGSSFVKMSVFSNMNCQSMVINATSVESGKCYTYCKILI